MSKERMTSDERRMAILEIATPIFAEKGFEKTTTKEVAEAAGVSEALLFKHFPSKHQLYEDLHHHCIEKSQVLLRLEPGSFALVQVAHMMLSEMFKAAIDKERPDSLNTFRLVLFSILEHSEFSYDFIASGPAKVINLFNESYRIAIENDEVTRPLDSNFAGWFVNHLSLGLAIHNLPISGPMYNYAGNHDRLLTDAIYFCLRGIGLKEEVIQSHLAKISEND